MAEPRAQRTLVKSPPELWAEISDLDSLARHLGDFGEIRITRLEPETAVAWEGDTVRGTVALEPSGWGTKVTLTATRLRPATSELTPEPEPTIDDARAHDEKPSAEDAPRVTRGSEGTAAATHAPGASVLETPTALATTAGDPPTAAAPVTHTPTDTPTPPPPTAGGAAWALEERQAAPERHDAPTGTPWPATPPSAPSSVAPPTTTPSPHAPPRSTAAARHVAPASAAAAAHQPEPQPTASGTDISAPLAHRGLFARLFGRPVAAGPASAPPRPASPQPPVTRKPLAEPAPAPQPDPEPSTHHTPEPAPAAAPLHASIPLPVSAQPATGAIPAPRVAPPEVEPSVIPRTAATGAATRPAATERPVPVPVPDPSPEPDAPIAQEPALDDARITGILTAMLDDLGAAHHRPFSRD